MAPVLTHSPQPASARAQRPHERRDCEAPADGGGWSAALTLAFERRAGRTVLASRRQRGPLAVQRPFYPEGGVCHLYLLHPPGGVVGGDRLDVRVEVTAGSHALLTTPGAAKFYRSAGPTAVQEQRLQIEDGGLLEWFPQENILFPGAMLRNRTRVDLAGGARFLGWELLSLGRPAIGERFDAGSADLGLAIFREGRPLLLERLRLDDTSALDGASGLRGFPVCATLVASGADASDLAAARGGLDATAGLPFAMTLLDDLLVARCLANGVEPVRRTFLRLWAILRTRLMGRVACPPRIWAT